MKTPPKVQTRSFGLFSFQETGTFAFLVRQESQTLSCRAGVAFSAALLIRSGVNSGRVLSVTASSAILRSAKGMIAATRDSFVKVPGLMCHPLFVGG
jgi:hypothetical protein